MKVRHATYPTIARARRKGVAVITALFIAVSFTTACAKKEAEHTDPVSNPSTEGGDFTELSTTMLVDLSDFPIFPGNKWDRGQAIDINPNNPTVFRPAECGPFVDGPQSSRVTAQDTFDSATDDDVIVVLDLRLPVVQVDLQELAAKCRSVSQEGWRTFTNEPLNSPGVPPWAVALHQTDDAGDHWATISGFSRGIFIRARYYEPERETIDPDLTNKTVEIFNRQVEWLASR